MNLIDLALEFRQQMLAGERATANALVAAYGSIWQAIQDELALLEQDIAAAEAAGVEVGPSWLLRQARYQRLLAFVEAQLGRFAAYAEGQIIAQQRIALGAGAAAAGRMLDASVATSWSRLPTHAIEFAVGTLQDGSPLRALFAELAPAGRAAAENALLRGIALRQPARLIARELQRELGIGLEQALTVARTEGLRAAREGQRQIFAASGVVTGWRWVSALTPRTCAMCWAMHGTIHQVDEIFGTHPCCRCTMVPVIRPELLTQPQTFATGAERFARLAGKTQLAILGRKKYNAYAAGDLALSDVVGYRDDPKWGPTRFERSYKSITGGSR